MLEDLEDVIDDIRELFTKMEQYDQYEQIPEEELDGMKLEVLVPSLHLALTGIPQDLGNEMLEKGKPELLFFLRKQGVERLSQSHLEFSYIVRDDMLLGKVRDSRSGIYIASPLSKKVEDMHIKLAPYRLDMGAVH